ncbi:MAG: hypothetical protein HYR68_06345 [Burkholderiales bacterium]|nr:hypothetical protein [Burkholderiales bacterium]
MKYLSADILFKEEAVASHFFTTIEPHLEADAWTLNKSLARLQLSPAIPADYFEFSIEAFKQFRNVINIEFYSGTRDEYEEIIRVIFAAGAHLLKLRVRADEYNETERYAAGKRIKKIKECDKEFEGLVIPDVNLEFTRSIGKYNFKKALSMLDQIDLSRIVFEEEHLLALIDDVPSTELTLALIARGALPKNRLIHEDTPLLTSVATMGSTAVLQAFFEAGFDPYQADSSGHTVLHAVLCSNKPGSIDAARYVAEQCAAKLNPVGEDGSPLWEAYYQQSNMAGAKYFRQLGAQSIAPAGFYDELSHEEIIIEAASHGDMDTLKAHFTEADYDIAVRKAIYSQALEMLQWLDSIKKIDWLGVVMTDQFDEAFLREVLLFETPFIFNSGDNADLDFYEMIIDAVAHHPPTLDVIAVYLAGFNGSSRLLRKLGKLGVRFVPALIEHGEQEYPLFKAALGGHLNNITALLEMGAVVPTYEDETFGEFALRSIDKSKAAEAKALFAKYGV